MRPDVSDDFRIHFSSSVLGPRYADNGIKILPKNSISTFNFWYSLCLYRANYCRKSFSLKTVGIGFLDVLRGRGWAHMWYLYVILILYLITPLLHRLMHALPECITFILIGVLFLGCSMFPGLAAILPNVRNWLPVLPGWMVYFLYYIIGFVFSEYCCPDTAAENNVKKFTALRWFYLLALGATAMGMIVSRLAGFTLLMGYNYPLTVVLSTLIFGCAQPREQWFEKRRTQYKWQCDENTVYAEKGSLIPIPFLDSATIKTGKIKDR